MRTWSHVALLAVIVTVSSTAAVEMERMDAADSTFFSLVEEKMERTSAMLESMLRSNFGFLRVQEPQEQAVEVLVLDFDSEETPFESVLKEEERQLSCVVALKQLAHQREMTKEAKSMHARLRSRLRPMFHMLTGTSTSHETCADLEQVAMVNECNRVLRMDKEIATWLKQHKSNEQICALVQSTENVEANPLSCKLCKRFVQMVNKAIEQDLAQVEQVREIIGDLCDSMSAGSMCHTFIKRYDDIVAWLKAGTEPATVCLQLTMCLPKEVEETMVVSRTDESHTCFYCVNINAIIRYVLNKAPEQEKTVHELLKYGCTLVPQNCKCSVLDENFDKIVDSIKQGKHPHEICESLQMCSKKLSPITSDVETSSTNDDVMKAVTELVLPTHALLSSHTNSDPNECFYCDYLATMVEIFIQEDAEDMELVRQYAGMFCDMLGDANICHQYITKMDFVVEGLKNNKKPREICKELKYCGAKVEEKAAAKVEEKAAITMADAPVVVMEVEVAVADDTHECFYCLHIVKVIRFVVHNSPDQLPKVQELIKHGCSVVPKECKCELLVQNFDKIVESIKQHKHPFEICESIGSCKKEQKGLLQLSNEEESKISKELVVAVVEENDNKTCLYCEVFTTLIEVAIHQDKEQIDEIRLYADIICGMLGDQSLCHQYVDKLDLVVDDIKKGESVRKICGDLKFCPVKHETAIGQARTTVNKFMVKSDEPLPQGDGNIMEVQ